MHQTTATIHAIFLALALLASQSWGYFATSQNGDTLIVEQSDLEPGEEGDAALELTIPPKSNKESEARTALPKTPKDSSKLTVYQTPTAPVWQLAYRYNSACYARASYRPRPPTQSSGYPHSHGNRGPPSSMA
jgi:hypothetical protein